MGREEFSKYVENTQGTSMDATVSGAVDVSDRSLRDLGQVDVVNAVAVDDSTPIDVRDTASGSPTYKWVSLIASGTSIASGSSASGTASPAAGETWILRGMSYHADVSTGTSGVLRVRVNAKASSGSSPLSFAEVLDLSAGYEIYGGVGSRLTMDGTGPVGVGTSCTYVLDEGALTGDSSELVFGESMRIKGVFGNDTDVSASNCRMSVLVQVV